MLKNKVISGWKDKCLFTPGPLTTSRTVKQAMLRDLGSRDFEFIETVRTIREQLLQLAGVDNTSYTAIPMQGSGTFGIEAVISTAMPQDARLMVMVNGAYGKRILKIAEVLKIDTVAVVCPENQTPDIEKITKVLNTEKNITMAAVVHCETTTGIINPIAEIGDVVQKANVKYFVDAMSSFGAIPVNMASCGIDYLVSSANKCIEGVPGFSFALAKLKSLRQTQGQARSLSLDLYEQWKGLESNGQFRFTPPTHALLAFRQALAELEAEGGLPGRAARYQNNYRVLTAGMRKMGFREYLPPEDQGYIITSFRYPDDSNFSFETFYQKLNERNYVIYPGKVSDADCFRIGNIGRMGEPDVRALLDAIQNVITDMKIHLK